MIIFGSMYASIEITDNIYLINHSAGFIKKLF